MNDGSEEPADAFTYAWILEGQQEPVSTNKDYSFVANYAEHNGKTIKLEVTYNDRTISSDPEVINVSEANQKPNDENNNISPEINNTLNNVFDGFDKTNHSNGYTEIAINVLLRDFDKKLEKKFNKKN